MNFEENECMLKQYPRIFHLKLIHHIYSPVVPSNSEWIYKLVYNLSTILNQLPVIQVPLNYQSKIFKTIIHYSKLLDIIAQKIKKIAEN